MRLAQLVAGLSLAADLGSGQPLDHTLRTCLRATSLGHDLGLDPPALRDVYYLSLLRFIGCTATSDDDVREVGGDEIAFVTAVAPVFMDSMPRLAAVVAREVGRDLPPLQRAGKVVRALTDSNSAQRTITAHCEVASRLADRLQMGPRIHEALRHAFERWDGRGIPGELAGDDIPIAVCIVVVARDAELWSASTDPETTAAMLSRRRGHAYAPAVVDALLETGPVVPDHAQDEALWDRVIAAEPAPQVTVNDSSLDAALGAFADFADLKSPYTRRHSSGVATLAADAARAMGENGYGPTLLHRAGLVHDLGRVGIPLSVWDREGPLSRSERERVRLHPYLTERVLSACPLEDVVQLARSHHERLDGSGYHRGCGPGELGLYARLLAAADTYQAMTEDRAFRPAHSAAEATAELQRAADDGLLDRRAVAAVLDAAGQQPQPARGVWPSGLTDREVDVLRLLARGRTNRQIAGDLVISAKTVGHHVEHIYTKAGVSTRAGATLFAMEQQLL